MATFANNFNAGPVNTAITTANSANSGTPFNEIYTSGGTPVIEYRDNGDNGLMAYIQAASSVKGALRWNFGSAQTKITMRKRLKITPGNLTEVFLNVFNSSYSVSFTLGLDSNNLFVAQHSGAVELAKSAAPVTEQWYRVECNWDKDTTTLRVRACEGNSTVPVWDVSTSATTFADAFYVRGGKEATGAAYTVCIDDWEIVTGSSEWLGPYPEPGEDEFNVWENDARVPITIRGEYVGGAITDLVVRGVTGQDLPSAEDFVIGETDPISGVNTGLGVLGLSYDDLEVYDGDLTLETGTKYEGLLIRGQVFAPAGLVGTELNNCSVVSRPLTNYVGGGIVNIASSITMKNVEVTQYDPTLERDNSVWWATAVKVTGGQPIIERCDFHDTLDGVYVSGVSSTVKVRGCAGRDWQFRNDDQDQSGSTPPYWTHNDGVQIMAGINHEIYGNSFDMRFSELTGMPRVANPDTETEQVWLNCHGILIQGQYSVVTGVKIYKNWFRYGSIGIRAAGGNNTGNTAEIYGNRFTPNQGKEFNQYTQMSNEPNTHWTLNVHDNVYSDDSDTPVEWRGQPLKAPETIGTGTKWQFNKTAHTP